jgi:tetratricopeptide (TPR) repeat protein
VKPLPASLRRKLFRLAFAGLVIWGTPLGALPADRPAESGEISIIELQGTVEIMPAGARTWVLTQTNQVLHANDKLRTGGNSRATLRWSDHSVVPFGALTEIEILPPENSDSLSGLHLIRGILSFFHRDKPGRLRVLTRGANASIEGTEFVIEEREVNGVERSLLSVLDGKVRWSNAQGELILTNHQQAVIEGSGRPAYTAGFIANNLQQWCFYYPAVLDPQDLSLTPDEEQTLKASLDAYRAGDLLKALAAYPETNPSSDSERIYHAALLLSVGQVEQTEAELATMSAAGRVDRSQRLANALRTLMAAVKRQEAPPSGQRQLSTEFLAASYYEQSRANSEESLRNALELARQAASLSPQFGFAWERVAELEFGFGRSDAAQRALDQSLVLAPRNAQALTLNGFLLAGRNQVKPALEWFDRALAVDPALGNAWLGRGLCRIRRGDAAGGRGDLLVAAAMEPQRSLLRSYLGKAYADAGEEVRASHELQLALKLDPSDPTGWLYSALLKQQQNRVNDAIKDLETSQAQNDNRSVFRSRLMLDEDQAVRSANLASIYRDAGMTDVSVREAAKAVSYDYANYSAHLFLADSYDALRDPTRFNLRYETVWFNEFLLANLLAPVGGGNLSQHVSQQEYSKLLQEDGLGIANSTVGRSDGSYTERGSQYGTFGGTSYSLDVLYQHNDGVRVNNELDDLEWFSTIKQQITPHDTAMALIKYENFHSGDNFQYYNPTNARPNFQFDEHQEPLLALAWNHEWSPGMHTLLLGGRLVNEQHLSDLATPQLLLIQDPSGTIVTHDFQPFDVDYHAHLEIYTLELNQILQWERVSVTAGGRYQNGTFDTRETLTNPPALVPFLFPNASDTTSESEDFQRITGYGYVTVEPVDKLRLTGGLAYDDMTFPANFRNPPISAGQDHRSQLGPKAALVWDPLPQVTLRSMYAKSLGGVSLDQSYRLEPTQLAGFPQTFRTLISESVVGSVTAPEYEVYGAALDLKFPTRTYAGIQAQQLNSAVRRTIGVFSLVNSTVPFVADTTEEHLDYRETSLSASVNQLLSDYVAVGVGYKWDQVLLNDTLPGVPVSALSTARQRNLATLQTVTAYVLFNHPSGIFARADVNWYHQQNSGYTPALPGDDFFQENIFAGYRCLRRRLELQVGILNLSGQDYRLNPLNTYAELPRKRTFTAGLNFIF